MLDFDFLGIHCGLKYPSHVQKGGRKTVGGPDLESQMGLPKGWANKAMARKARPPKHMIRVRRARAHGAVVPV